MADDSTAPAQGAGWITYSGIMLILDSTMALVVPLVMMALLHPLFLATPLLFAVGLVVTVWDYNRRLKPVSIKQREHFGIMNSGLAETINGIEVVKASVGERYELDKFTGVDDAHDDQVDATAHGFNIWEYLPQIERGSRPAP